MTTSPPRRKRPAKASATTATVAAVTHPDAAELRPSQSIALLRELHLLTREGRLNQDARRKLKQVYHHTLHTREFGSQLTNVLRWLRLEASGYHVTLTEFVG